MALHHVEPGEIAGLSPLGDHLRDVRTYALVKTDRFEAVRLVLPADTTIAEHRVEGPVTLHCLEGKFVLTRNGGELTMESDDWVYLAPGEPHALKSLEDASVLVTIIF